VATVLNALPGAPAGPRLLAAAAGLDGVHLVGGAVRDLLLGRTPRELDVVTEDDPQPLLDRLGDATVRHQRFGTATVTTPDGRIDVARARRERYDAPGALPDVEPAPLAEDLLRRDFTVNAIAVDLATGHLQAAPEALADLEHRRLRVLHDQSFVDDPTRLLRLARYRERLHFSVEPHTAELAGAATLAGVSGARVGAELRLALGEPDPLAVLDGIAGLPVRIDAPLARRATQLAPEDARVDLMMLGILTRDSATAGWLESLELTARERDIVLAVWAAPGLDLAGGPGELHAALRDVPVEAVAVAGALGPAAAARRYLDELRHVRLEIDGGDLLAAGLHGPEIGRRLARTLVRKLDGELSGRAAELADALR
jgi:tRNA nucleotidyltransferase (CCA-adding enzyme)